MTTLTGCSVENSNDPGDAPKTREVHDVEKEAQELSSQILEIINLRGKVSEPGPGVALCGEKDSEKYYVIHHPWSVAEVPVEDLRQAMTRLREEMPKKGWKVTKYGPDQSPSRSLALKADSTQKEFSVRIYLYDESRKAKPEGVSMIYAHLASACFQVPEGKTVEEY
ncbi:hypothetical protein RKE29_05465 [Streptomyces sp. B1866]|nr:hypothetical protein [Streptomyces sp. B1866]